MKRNRGVMNCAMTNMKAVNPALSSSFSRTISKSGVRAYWKENTARMAIIIFQLR